MDTQESRSPFISIQLSLALVALSLCVFFFGQIKGVGTATVQEEDPEQELELNIAAGVKTAMETMRWQSSNADKQIVAYKEAREKLAKAIDERRPGAAAATDLQTRFAQLIKKVNELSKGDDRDEAVKDAKNIIGILVNSGITSINVPDAPAASEAKNDR